MINPKAIVGSLVSLFTYSGEISCMLTSRSTKSLKKPSLALILLTTVGLSTSQSATAATFTVGGFTWDEVNSVSTAEVVEGSMDFEMALLSNFGQGLSGFDYSRSTGQLLGYNPNPNFSSSLPFPDAEGGANPPLPNVDRTTIELTWGDRLLPNLSGDDFVIYEVGSQEGFSVSILRAGESNFTTNRYEFSDRFDATQGVFATGFNLDDFGLGADDLISAIQITNLFNSEAAAGADRVDDPSGQGNVLYPGDAGYNSGFTLTTEPFGSEYLTSNLDADIVYVVGLHDLVAQRAAQPVPEPASVLGLLAFGAFGVGSRLLRQQIQRTVDKG